MIFKTVNSINILDYKALIKLAEATGVFKACGNHDNMWVILKFKDEEHYLNWVDNNIN